MITSTSFVFENSNKRFTILDIYDDNNIKPPKPPEPLNTIISQEEPKNKCCIIS
jgi:hypothetical protein